jgi:8-amino-7-oxononanoate synthase
VDGRDVLLFNSNDYLGLADHPRVKARAREALERWGFGAPSSRLIAGTAEIHRALEEALAAFKGEEDALLFPAGYMTNLGVIPSLAERGDLVLSDAKNHASIVDACRLARAEVRIYPHGDAGAVADALARRDKGRRAFVVTDAVFSMDGDVAPLPDLRRAADAHGARLIVDEAHSTGVLGTRGRGIREHFGGVPVEVNIGTLGKALGGAGGFVAGSRALVDLVRNRARTFFYTTAPLPALCAGVLEALSILESEPGRVASLASRSSQLREGLRARGIRAPGGASAIVPVVLGSSETTQRAADALFEAGYFVTGIRPPTVEPGTARLRLVVNEPHTEAEISEFADALARLIPGARDVDPPESRV